MLEVKDLTVTYGKVAAIEDINLRVGDGELVALVGHNGAGKTTLLRAISGLQRPRDGKVHWDGKEVAGQRPDVIARSSIAFVPQGRNVFADLSVEDNLRIAHDAATRPGMSEDALLDIFPALRERRLQRAGSLSGGQQQMLALSLALARGPRLIMLDEPSTGLAPVLVQTVFSTIQRLHAETRTSFLIVDQNVEHLLAVTSRAYVLKAGRLVFDGEAGKLRGPDLWQYF